MNGQMDTLKVRDGQSIDRRVRDAGLRPTRQRLALASLLFAKGDRHLSAEELHEEAQSAGVPVSLATVYNTLNQFKAAALARNRHRGRPQLLRHQHVQPLSLLSSTMRSTS